MGNIRWIAIVSVVIACGPTRQRPGPGGGGDGGQGDAPSCSTSISGKVFAPNGTLPLYNVLVYEPVNDPPPFPSGVQCGGCTGADGSIAHTTSDAEGKFRLDGVLPGNDVPVIVTTGKWRRKVTIPTVTACQDNPIADGTFRLPKNRSEGELPRIAHVSGGCDALACVLWKIGVDSTEFGDSSSGPTSVVFYDGEGGASPGTPQPATALWGSLDELKKFDLVINSCECSEFNEEKTSPDLLRQYADMGGRVFGSHFHYTWQKNLIPQWRTTATWGIGSEDLPDLVDMTMPSGQALAQWLLATGASTTLGQITLGVKTYNATSVQGATQRWLHSSGSPETAHYMSFLTPVGAPQDQQCGKVVFAGMHVAAGVVSPTFPMSCSTTFSASEKALAFLLFDLTSCSQNIP